MRKLTFHQDKNFLMDWLNFNSMSTGEIVLWHTLMNIGNKLGQKSVFNVPTSTLMKFTGLSNRGVTDARNKLKTRGFIKFVKGRANQAPVYEMMPIHKTFQNMELPIDETTPENMPIHNESTERSSKEENKVTALCEMFEANICKATPIIREELIKWLNVFDEKAIEEVIRITTLKGGKTFSYMEKILEEWQRNGLKTLEAIHTYELEKELARDKKLIRFQTSKKQTKEQSLDDWLKEEF